jgi:L-asparaginase / beta-aspartyl-peptidase
MLSRPPTSHPQVPPTRRGFGLTLLTTARNPIKLARALYLSPTTAPHTMLSGTFAADLVPDLPQVDPEYFFTEKRWREHRRGLGLPEEPLPYPPKKDELEDAPLDELPKGTVGAVALDIRGCLAAATSTGGKTNKLVGRIGDTPQVGSGFWAEEWKVKGWIKRKLRKIHKKPIHDGVASK